MDKNLQSKEKFCYFCQKSIGELSNSSALLSCMEHEVRVTHWYNLHVSEDTRDIYFYIKIKDKLFRVTLIPSLKRTIIDIPNEAFNSTAYLINTNILLNITPENARDKIATILTFS